MFEPREVEVTTFWDAGEEHYSATKRPLVTLWADDFFRGLRPALTPEMLGYRYVLRYPDRPLRLYARPWLLWAVLRVREALRYQFWAFMRANRDIGAIHCNTQEGVCFRWRDLRLGRGQHEQAC